MVEFQHWPEIFDYLKAQDLIGPMADVGACTGNWTMNMLEAGAPVVYAVDLWEHVPGVRGDLGEPQEEHDRRYVVFLEGIAEFLGRVVILKGRSPEMAERIPDKSLTCCYLDCGHAREATFADLIAYYPKMRSGSLFAGHDYLNEDYGVREAVDAFAAARGLEVGVIPEDDPSYASFFFVVP